MLRQTHRAYLLCLVVADTCATSAAWLGAYAIRMQGIPVPVEKGVPPLSTYVGVLPLALLTTWFAFRAANLYRPRPDAGPLGDTARVARASLLGVVFLLAGLFFVRGHELSRVVVLNFAVCHPVSVALGRAAARSVAARLRARGFGVRRALVLGAGRRGQELVDALRRRPALGVEPVAFCDDRETRRRRTVRGLPVVGALADAPAQIRALRIDEVFVALPMRESAAAERLLDGLAEEVVDVRLVADLGATDTLRTTTGELDGLPIVSLRDTPLAGFGAVVKRAEDLVVASIALVSLSWLLGLIALAVKLTSRGPVLFRQERMGLDGRTFQMCKFRSMRVDAEAKTGAVWAQKDDPRRTPIGALLRRTSLDELPQFWNVLRGDMSVVGPRPERPVFIEQFRKTIPGYMLRHKVKSGITGWAQVCGLRGNTSLRKRIQYDLYYIRRWSLGFDVWIMFLTVFRGLVGKHAY